MNLVAQSVYYLDYRSDNMIIEVQFPEGVDIFVFTTTSDQLCCTLSLLINGYPRDEAAEV